ncbi:response regulator transcription factor (plasmid) [Paenibacillus rhizovicinus]|uniref:Response regulator transcription factor n=1 Tax=Paenibacillus rhizovicinus TaxID=2704463 RepID=A0A6C0P9W3_9BACL|nr:response regulator transcription factor [Paenibacillus rhizovicinus]QHW35410.1 response regulator transcription factor [Paenibacillus rhizovicinus]
MQPMRILIADDHADAREGIRTIIEGDPFFEVVGEARNGLEAIDMTVAEMPDLILMDINMKEMDGLEATKIIKERFPYIKIVMVTVSDDITNLFEAIKRGAQGYLLKNINPSSWHSYLRAVALDEVPMSRELAMRFLREFVDHEKAPQSTPLTPRETEILTWVSKGAQNRDIASHLNISEHTVKNHLKNILQKLHLENRVQLARYAYERGLGMDH